MCAAWPAASHHEIAALESGMLPTGLGSSRAVRTTRSGLCERGHEASFGRTLLCVSHYSIHYSINHYCGMCQRGEE
jgi:hypothetical protein